MDSGCEIFGSVAVHCGRTDPLGAQGRLDTGVVLAKNLVTYCFGICQDFPRRAFVLAVFFSSAHVVLLLGSGCADVFSVVSRLICRAAD